MYNFHIRDYRSSDYEGVRKMVIALHSHIIRVDKFNRHWISAEFGDHSTKVMIDDMEKKNGKILVVESEEDLIGLGASIVYEQTDIDRYGVKPFVYQGRITELFVNEEYRGKGIGKQLIELLEQDLKSKGCSLCRLEVYGYNENAHEFYKEQGFKDEVIDMIKIY